ncbi:MAG: hypothetical protein KC731_36225 [Myxococcales bacterium]|nr:hypothetical protein [Myxococcales bacterium]
MKDAFRYGPQVGLSPEDEEKHYAFLVVGRRMSMEDVPLSRRKLGELVEVVAEAGRASGLPLSLIYMSTTVNWTREPDEVIDVWDLSEVLIGIVVAAATYPGDPVVVRRDAIAAVNVDQLPDALWQELEQRHGVSTSEPSLYLACSGWTVAELFPGESPYDPSGQCFENADERIAATCAEDTTPGVRLDVGSLPAEMKLRAFYA